MNLRTLAERFCAAPLPESVCADVCATLTGPGRSGTNLLTVQEAEAVLGYTLGAMPRAARDVLAERERQINVEGWTPEHDDVWNGGELGLAGACYAVEGSENCTLPGDPCDPPNDWPFARKWWKPSPEPRRNLVKAAALILAEIERLDRQQ